MKIDDLSSEEIQRLKDENMLVYFNEYGEILCITPIPDESLSHLKYTRFPIFDLLDFIEGNVSMSSYRIVKKNKKHIIEKKESFVKIALIEDKFLTEVPKYNSEKSKAILSKSDIRIKFYKSDNHLQIKMNAQVRNSLLGESKVTDGNKITVNGLQKLPFYITAPGDPSFLLKPIYVDTALLVQNQYVEYTIEDNIAKDMDRVSIFTKKVLDKYAFEVKNERD